MAVIEPSMSGDFLAGLQAGLERADRHGLRTPPDTDAVVAAGELPEALARAQELLSRGEASGRFTELFAEMVTVAVAARDTYGDEPLTAQQVDTYLEHSYSIFNSFRHA
jgi:hypothetical protein